MKNFELNRVSPDALKAMFAFEAYVKKANLDKALVRLIKVRASQINGCAYCLDMHTKDARLEGETEQRLYALSAWRDTPFFTDKERIGLEWAERLTLMAEGHVSEELEQRARSAFTDTELVDLTMAVVAINGWNRLVATFGPEPGTYQPPRAQSSE
jgi:AhpD family alkylhydroperoxidase